MRKFLLIIFLLWPAPTGPFLGVAEAAQAKSVKVIEGPIFAQVVRVRDGDSIDVIAHVWPGTQMRVSVRLAGIDAPELRARCEAEKRLAVAARDRLSDLVRSGPVHLKQVRGGKYFGRILARVSAGGTDVQKIMLNENLARPYGGRQRKGWCNGDELARG
ncbi:MAG: thermonuclease family protein [Pseudomonadota bacterium]